MKRQGLAGSYCTDAEEDGGGKIDVCRCGYVCVCVCVCVDLMVEEEAHFCRGCYM
jgi:hypothetical protein